MFSILNISHDIRTCHKRSYCRIAVPDCLPLASCFNLGKCSYFASCAAEQENPFSLSQGTLHQEIWKTSSFRVVVGIVAPDLSGTRWHQVPISVVAEVFGTFSPSARAVNTAVTPRPAGWVPTQQGLSLLVSA